jgi:hypothetical protein
MTKPSKSFWPNERGGKPWLYRTGYGARRLKPLAYSISVLNVN